MPRLKGSKPSFRRLLSRQPRTSLMAKSLPPKVSGIAPSPCWSKRLELDPNSSGAYGLLISTYLATNRLPEAIAQLEAVLTKNPKEVRALMLSALIYEKMNDLSKARDAYEKLLAVDPDFAPALNNLAYLYAVRLNDLDKAYGLAQKARALQPGDPAIADTLGWILYKRADYQQALTILQESAEKLPGNPEIQFHLGMANHAMGRLDEARTALRQAVATPADFPDKEEARRRLSSLEGGDSKVTELSISELEKILNEKPDDIVTQVRLGEAYEKQGEFAQAAAAYEEALKRNPKTARDSHKARRAECRSIARQREGSQICQKG